MKATNASKRGGSIRVAMTVVRRVTRTVLRT
jgi:hypothetical protein